LKVETKQEKVRCNVIQKQEFGTFTKRISKEIPVIEGKLDYLSADCALLLVMERYGKNGNIAKALMTKPMTKKGAIGTTWAHDHHNLMVMGNDEASILLAQKELLKMQGGYVVIENGKIKATCPLPIGGIISLKPIEELGADLQKVRQAIKHLGYNNFNEIMSFSTLSLPVSPAIKVTDFGMMNTKTQEFYPLVFEEDGVLFNETTN
jgi:adenine deaminase